MSNVFIASLASACILVAVETFLISLGKFRGLLALGASFISLVVLGTHLRFLPIYGLAVTFLGLVLSMGVEELFNQPSARELPKRIPMR